MLQKGDAADAEAICEEERGEPGRGGDLPQPGPRSRDLLVRQRTPLINALRGHMGEFGLVGPQGAARAKELTAMVSDLDTVVPDAARSALQALATAPTRLAAEIRRLEAEIVRRAREDEVARRLMTIPGVGPLIATALVALAPPPQTFRRGRDFAAWLGLTPRPHATGGKQRLGATTKREVYRVPAAAA